MKRLRKILLYSGAVVLVVVLVAVATAYFFSDKIISHFVEEANKHLATPVKIGKMDVSMLSDFPEMSITFKDVYVEDSHPGEFPLFKAKEVSFAFNAYDAWQGKYSIKGLRIRSSETNIRINEKGKPNYIVTKDTASSGGDISFDIHDIRLRSQQVTYVDEYNHQSHEFSSESLSASIITGNNQYKISAVGDLTSKQVGIGDLLFFRNNMFDLSFDMVYDDVAKLITFNPSSIQQEKGKFELMGTYVFKDKITLDLKVDGKETSLQTIFSFLPESLAKPVEQYESEGDLNFGLTVKGGLRSPRIIVEFGSQNATILHPETNFRISQANLKGRFSSFGLTDFTTATLQLQNVSGQLNNKNFSGELELKNLEHPHVNFQFKGELDAVSLKPFFDQAYLKDASGTLVADISLEGDIEKLKNRKTAQQQVKIDGSVEMKDVSLSTRIRNIDLKNLSGNFQFTNNDLAMSDVHGTLGKSDFLLNGFFKNIVSYLIFEDQPIGIETDLKSEFLDLDELLQLAFGQETSGAYQFSLSPNLYLNFDCKVERLKYQKFRATDVDGNLLVKNKAARTDKIKLKTMGGSLSLSGVLDARTEKKINLTATSKLSSIHLDSLFYVFGNFKQEWLQDKHLKGQASADLELETDFTRELKIIPQTLVADMELTVKKGELNNFEPMQQLNRYLDDEGLKQMRFADLKNEIHIEKEVILIPKMEVRTNVTTIQISGRHTFDQHIDYRIVAPLRNKKKINVDEAGEAFQQEGGRMKVYFKITGTTDNYKVAYDTDALKQKVATDLKKELAELKDAFKDKNAKKKTLELEKDDYFEWDNENN